MTILHLTKEETLNKVRSIGWEIQDAYVKTNDNFYFDDQTMSEINK